MRIGISFWLMVSFEEQKLILMNSNLSKIFFYVSVSRRLTSAEYISCTFLPSASGWLLEDISRRWGYLSYLHFPALLQCWWWLLSSSAVVTGRVSMFPSSTYVLPPLSPFRTRGSHGFLLLLDPGKLTIFLMVLLILFTFLCYFQLNIFKCATLSTVNPYWH